MTPSERLARATADMQKALTPGERTSQQPQQSEHSTVETVTTVDAPKLTRAARQAINRARHDAKIQEQRLRTRAEAEVARVRAREEAASATRATGDMTSFTPTPEQKHLVRQLAGIGCTVAEVLLCIPWGREDNKPISRETFDKHFDGDFEFGDAMAKSRVKKSLFEMAVGKEGSPPNLQAQMFWLRIRAGWNEKIEVNNTGAGGVTNITFNQVQCYLPEKVELPKLTAPADTIEMEAVSLPQKTG